MENNTLRQVSFAFLFVFIYILMSSFIGLIVAIISGTPNIKGTIGEVLGIGLIPLILGIYLRVSPINLIRNIAVIAIFALGAPSIEGASGKSSFVVFYFSFLTNFVLINVTCLAFIFVRKMIEKNLTNQQIPQARADEEVAIGISSNDDILEKAVNDDTIIENNNDLKLAEFIELYKKYGNSIMLNDFIEKLKQIEQISKTK